MKTGKMRKVRKKLRGEKKVQSALEYLTTYFWALLVVGIVVAVYFLTSKGTSNASVLPSQCTITASLLCYQSLITTNSLGTTATVVFTNNLGKPIYFPKNSDIQIKLTATSQYYNGTCTPTTANPGEKVTCTTYVLGYTPQFGTQLNPQFSRLLVNTTVAVVPKEFVVIRD